MTIKHHCKVLGLVLPLLAASTTHAFTLSPWELSASVGLSQPFKSNTAYINNNGPYPADAYLADKEGSPVALDLALIKPFLTQQHTSVFGLHYNTTLGQKHTGTIAEYNLPQFENYRYQYTLSRQTLLASYQFNLTTVDKPWQPYILGAVGLSMNSASSYSQSPETGVTTPMASPRYGNHTHISSAFEAGFGVAKKINPNVQLHIQYTYLDAGKASLGQGIYGEDAPGQTLQYNMIMFGADYRF